MESFIFLSCFLLLLLMIAKFITNSKKVPPGPTPLPIIGNLHQLNGPLPHRILADLAKKYGPLMHLQLGEISTLVASSPAAAKEFLNDHDIIFANRPFFLSTVILHYNCQDLAFSPYGSFWRQMRKICTVELLSVRRVQTFRSLREEEVMNMIKAISSQKGSVVNLSHKVSSLTYSIIAQAAFGKRSKYQDEFIALVDEVVKQLVAGFCLVDLYPSVKILEKITGIRSKLEKTRVRVDTILQSILTDHKNKRESKPGNEDLVDALVNVQESGEYSLTDDNLKGVIYDIFVAGGETSSTTVIWALLEMMKNPTILKRSQDEVREVFGNQGNADESKLHELKYLHAVVKETLRFHPALPLLLPRESSEECKINGYTIPAKTRVIVNAFAINRDPTHWKEPDKFNPDRFLEAELDYKGNNFFYIPFGAGRRICPGMTFAFPSIELSLAQLLFHFDWKLPGALKSEDLDMTEEFGVSVGPKNYLCLIPTIHPLSNLN